MKVSIRLKAGEIDLQDSRLGKLAMTEIIMNQPLFQALKKVGFKRLHKIRSIRKVKVVKCPHYTIEAAEDLKMLHSIDLEDTLIRVMNKELDEFRASMSSKKMRQIINGLISKW